MRRLRRWPVASRAGRDRRWLVARSGGRDPGRSFGRTSAEPGEGPGRGGVRVSDGADAGRETGADGAAFACPGVGAGGGGACGASSASGACDACGAAGFVGAEPVERADEATVRRHRPPPSAVLPVAPMMRDGAIYAHCRFPEAFTRSSMPVIRQEGAARAGFGPSPGAPYAPARREPPHPSIPEADRKRIGTPEIWFRKRCHWSDRSTHMAHRPTRGACRIR